MTFDSISRDGRSRTCYVPIAKDSNLEHAEATKKWDKRTHVAVVIDYFLGGKNWLTESYNPRGYRVCVHPVELRDGCVCRTLAGTFLQSGGYVMLAEAKAFNAKKFEAWVKAAEPHVEAIAAAFSCGAQNATVDAMTKVKG